MLLNYCNVNALHIATHASNSEYLLCIDADALLDNMAPYYIIKHFLKNGDHISEVTGRHSIRNRGTILGRVQPVEYASIIRSIKRTQRILLGKVMTVSRVI